jgi:methionyl-tRNA synthetase
LDRAASDRFYISTAIPYVNARPHIGFAFEAVLADSVARYQRARGRDVFFLTGTDDNSLKNVEAAEQRGLPTEQVVEENAEQFFKLKDSLGLSFDDFIRTSKDPRHSATVEKIWNACAANGDIYEGEYRGLYCVGCERFYAPDELTDGLCPEHIRPPEEIRERNWFFRLSRYQDVLADRIENRELQILPESRRAEILSFIRSGLEDISISRSSERSRGWGLSVPGDPSQVVYVWFDALTNYISALDFASEGPLYEKYWNENRNRVHVIGKGILRFHAAYWPAMLLSAGLPLPSTMLVHGYLTTEGRKISKSLGDTTDPHELSGEIGVDALRYYLLSQFHPANDGDFSVEQLRTVHDSDLADQLGNLVGRVTSMIGRYCDGRVPAPDDPDGSAERQLKSAARLFEEVDASMSDFEVDRAIHRIWELVREANRYVVEQAPWNLAKEPGDESGRRLRTVLYNLAETIRIVTVFASPYIPSKASEVARAFSLGDGWDQLSERRAQWGLTKPGSRNANVGALFPRGWPSPSNSNIAPMSESHCRRRPSQVPGSTSQPSAPAPRRTALLCEREFDGPERVEFVADGAPRVDGQRGNNRAGDDDVAGPEPLTNPVQDVGHVCNERDDFSGHTLWVGGAGRLDAVGEQTPGRSRKRRARACRS